MRDLPRKVESTAGNGLSFLRILLWFINVVSRFHIDPGFYAR